MEHLKSESDGLSKGLELCHSFLGLLDLLRIAHRTTRTKHPAPRPKSALCKLVTRSLANTTPTMLVWPSWPGWGWCCFRFGVGLASWWRVKEAMRLLVENFEVFETSSLRPFEWWIALGGGGRRVAKCLAASKASCRWKYVELGNERH